MSHIRVNKQTQLKDALQLISVFSISRGRRQRKHSVGRAEGVAGRPVPTPPAHGIKDTAAGAQIEMQQFTFHQTVLCNMDNSSYYIAGGAADGSNNPNHLGNGRIEAAFSIKSVKVTQIHDISILERRKCWRRAYCL